MTLRSCVLQPVAEEVAGSDFPGSFQCQPAGCEPSRRWAASVPLCQGAAAVEELVSIHDVQAYHRTRCQNSRCQFGVVRLLERHRPAGGTAAPAGVPPGRVFRHPRRAVSEALERAEGTLSEDSKKGSLPSWRVRLRCCAAFRVGLSAWPMLTCSVETSSCARLGGVWTVLTAGAPPVPPRPGGCARKAATWLILPVVICLSQRLSHACLSINCFIL